MIATRLGNHEDAQRIITPALAYHRSLYARGNDDFTQHVQLARALYALSEEKMTIKQLGVLNKHNVPGRAMTVDMLMNIFLLLYFQNI